MEPETFMTVKDAAARIGVTEAAIRNATLEGRLSFTVMYGRKLIAVKDLEEYQSRAHPGGKKPKGRPRRAEAEADVA